MHLSTFGGGREVGSTGSLKWSSSRTMKGLPLLIAAVLLGPAAIPAKATSPTFVFAYANGWCTNRAAGMNSKRAWAMSAKYMNSLYRDEIRASGMTTKELGALAANRASKICPEYFQTKKQEPQKPNLTKEQLERLAKERAEKQRAAQKSRCVQTLNTVPVAERLSALMSGC